MKQFTGLVKKMSRGFDRIAGLCLVGIMLIVVANVVLKVLFKQPILGTPEYVNLLTAVGIAMALAYCAFQDGHIAVGFVVDKLPCKMQAFIDIITNIIALLFWGLAAWYLAQYAGSMSSNGLVAPTTQLPLSPFVYLIALGTAGLCMVIFVKLHESIKKVLQ